MEQLQAATTDTPQRREVLAALESALRASPQFDLEANTITTFIETPHGRFVSRELHIPKGVCVLGAIHLHANYNVMLKGKLRFVSDDGCIDRSAPEIVVSPAGTQRAALALEDSIWITVCPTTAKSVAEAREQLVAETIDDYNKKLEGMRCLGAT